MNQFFKIRDMCVATCIIPCIQALTHMRSQEQMVGYMCLNVLQHKEPSQLKDLAFVLYHSYVLKYWSNSKFGSTKKTASCLWGDLFSYPNYSRESKIMNRATRHYYIYPTILQSLIVLPICVFPQEIAQIFLKDFVYCMHDICKASSALEDRNKVVNGVIEERHVKYRMLDFHDFYLV